MTPTEIMISIGDGYEGRTSGLDDGEVVWLRDKPGRAILLIDRDVWRREEVHTQYPLMTRYVTQDFVANVPVAYAYVLRGEGRLVTREMLDD